LYKNNNNHHLFSLFTFQLHSCSSSDNTAGSVGTQNDIGSLEGFYWSSVVFVSFKLCSFCPWYL